MYKVFVTCEVAQKGLSGKDLKCRVWVAAGVGAEHRVGDGGELHPALQ